MPRQWINNKFMAVIYGLLYLSTLTAVERTASPGKQSLLQSDSSHSAQLLTFL